MNEEGSHASFATLETRLVSAGKVGVKVLLQSGHNLDDSSSYRKKTSSSPVKPLSLLKAMYMDGHSCSADLLKSGLGEVNKLITHLAMLSLPTSLPVLQSFHHKKQKGSAVVHLQLERGERQSGESWRDLECFLLNAYDKRHKTD